MYKKRKAKISEGIISEIIIVKIENGIPRGIEYTLPQTSEMINKLEELLDHPDVKKRTLFDFWH